MLQINDLQYSIGSRILFTGVNWMINPGKRVALIGPNGTGKTTLLRAINGEIPCENGRITTPKGYSIGFLRQEESAVETGKVLEYAMKGCQDTLSTANQIAEIHDLLETNPADQEILLEKLGKLQDRFTLFDGYRLESEAKAILSGLGFKESDFEMPLSDFSGGWQMRVHLGRLLLQSPDLLLLDEPTNHLDLESLQWLEQYLRTFEGSMVIVSHDRFFIDRLAQEICELDNGKLNHYAGNYHFFENQKVLRHEQLLKKWEEGKAERERIQRFIDRFRYKATKAAQVQSRIKQLEKMEKIEIPPAPKRLSFCVQVETTSFKDVLKIENMSFKYDKHWVLKDINLNIYRGEKIALVGINGAGKTTLTRLICGQLKPVEGRLHIGQRVQTGYYAQHQIDTLNLEKSIFEEVANTAADSHRLKLRDTLGIFQFSGGDPDKVIGVLSGGEKARVSLAKILLSPVNFLIMDEPTNHLDINSQAALEKALEEYDGTLLLISHDRYFLDKLVSRVIEVKDGGLNEFEGNYSAYLDRCERQAKLKLGPSRQTGKNTDASKSFTKPTNAKERKRLEAQARQAISKQRNHLKKTIKDSESMIAKLEEKKLALEKTLADPASYKNSNKAANLPKEYAALKNELDYLMEKWENAQMEFQKLMESL